MSSRRLACIILGAWIAASIFMSWVAAENLRSVERTLHDPTASAIAQIKQLGYDNARQLLRYQAGESNRLYFHSWETVQLVLGLLLFGLLLFGTDSGKYTLIVPVLMLLLVALEHYAITPYVALLGRALEMLPGVAKAQDEARFRALHQAYGGIEIAKLLLGMGLSGVMVFTGRARRRKVHKPRPDPSGKRELYPQ
jgi:hypothetical protein